MGKALSTLGVHLAWAIGTSTSTKVADAPKTGYKDLPDIVSIPEMDAAAEGIDASTLNNETFKSYVKGLKDIGGSKQFKFNLTEEFQNAWDEMYAAYEEVKEQGFPVWYVILHPGMTRAGVFCGEPAALGTPEIGVNGVMQTNASITPNGEPGWLDIKPTVVTE
jgi:hypothetical protein